MPEKKTNEDLARHCERMLGLLASIRQPFEGQIDEIISFVNHSRRKITDKDAMKGQKTGIDVYDGTALLAKNLLVDGMVGYTCSRSLRWFGLTLPNRFNFPRASGMRAWSGKRMDEYPEVKRWLEDCEDVLYGAFLRSNFYDIIPEFVGDGATIGTSTVTFEEDLNRAAISFTVPHFRECYLSENRYGIVDTLYRVYRLTLRQLRDKFGLEKMIELDQTFKDKLERNPYDESEIIHAIYPRVDRDPEISNGANKPVASIWVLRSPLKLLLETGYEFMPSVTWRWRKNSDEWYGRSPAWDAYVDIVLANQQAKTNLIAAHKMAEPPMVGLSDLRGKVSQGPAGWTWIDNMEKQFPRPLVTGIQLPFALDQQERTDKAIKEHFHVNFFLMLYQAAFNKVNLTATQVLGMQGEHAAVLGTRIGRLESEAFNPIIDGVWGVEERAGRLPEAPMILQDLGGNIEVDYLGPLSQAQRRLSKSRGIQAGIQMVGEIASIEPTAIDRIDMDETVKEALESTGFPPKCMRADDAVARIREIRAKQQAAALQAELMLKMAKTSSLAAKGPEAGSPMEKLMGSSEEQAQ